MRKIIFTLVRLISLNYFFKRNQKNRVLILMFHQVNDKGSLFFPAMNVETFRNLCKFVKDNYLVIPISELKSHFSKSSKPVAIISFDDGYYDIIEYALPILTRFGLNFNVNIDTELLETGKPQDFVRVYDILNTTSIKSYYNPKFMSSPIEVNKSNPMLTENEFTELLSQQSITKRRELVEDLALKAEMPDSKFSRMLSIQNVEELNRVGVEFGSHSHSHQLLTKISMDEVKYELSHSKNILEKIIKKRINILAYPNGQYNEKIKETAIQCGYEIFLETDDEINKIQPNLANYVSYKRVNQYHLSIEEALAHTYGITKIIKKLIH